MAGPDRDEFGQLVQYRGRGDSPKCSECPCAKQGRPFKSVRAFGASGGLCIVGEGPGSEEMFQGYPFVGPSGKLVDKVLRTVGIDRMLAWVTNSILCSRPAEDALMAKAIECCRPRLEEELQAIKPTTILALGGTATRALRLPVITIGEARGTVQYTPLLPHTPVVTTIHPAAILRGGAGESASSGGKNKMNVDAQFMFFTSDVEKAERVRRGEIAPKWHDAGKIITKPEENPLEAVKTIIDEARTWGMLGIDLEWLRDNTITWIGFGHGGEWADSNGAKGEHGRAFSFWRPTMSSEVIDVMREAMADETLPKLIHNLQADKHVWESGIGPVRGVINDTMLMHHAAFPGLAHDLQNVASQFLVVPPWKTQRREERKETEKKMRETEKATKKEATKAERQAVHEAKNAAKAAEREAKAVVKQKAHLARNAATKADAALRKAKKTNRPADVEKACEAAAEAARLAADAHAAGAEYADDSLCSICRKPQILSPGGPVCADGHGAAPPVPEAPEPDPTPAPAPVAAPVPSRFAFGPRVAFSPPRPFTGHTQKPKKMEIALADTEGNERVFSGDDDGEEGG